MFNFFAKEEQKTKNGYVISGNDYNHIINVLRMKTGDSFLVSFSGKSDLCVISEITACDIICEIKEENYNDTSLPIEIHLFQGLPKAEKMELIIQKCVELGVECIYPTQMEHCVVKLDDKKKASKTERWQKIAESAAKQCKRSIIPKIYEPVSFKNAVDILSEMDLFIVPYENELGMEATKNALKEIKNGSKIGILIGPEGGFSQKEIDFCTQNGGKIISLGKRILRTETAAITAVGMCMLYSEMNV